MLRSFLGRAFCAAVVTVVTITGIASAGLHAPWPDNWNNWTDPKLWATVGNPGNAGELSGEAAGGYGPNRICGAVGYTYRMGKFEVTSGQYTEFLNAVAKTDTYGLYNTNMNNDVNPNKWGCNIKRSGDPGTYHYEVYDDPNVPGQEWANRPVNYVSWGDSARFVNWMTNGQKSGTLTGIPAQDAWLTEDGSYALNGATSNEALLAVERIREEDRVPGKKYYCIPSEDEWYKAAYHKNDGVTGSYWDYPTGTDNTPSNDLIDPDPGNNANFLDGGYTIGSPDYRTEVGEFENSESPYVTFDQGGNVFEWDEAVLRGSYRGYRGGSLSAYDASMRASARPDDYPTGEGSDIGFRVAEVPEPGCAGLFLIGFLLSAG